MAHAGITRQDVLAMSSDERKDHDAREESIRRAGDKADIGDIGNWENSSALIRPQGSWVCRECGYSKLPSHVKCGKLSHAGISKCNGTQTESWGGLAIGAKPPPAVRPQLTQCGAG